MLKIYTELEDAILVSGDLYWIKKNGKKLKLVNAGEVINQNKLKQYKEKEMELKINSLVDEEVVCELEMKFRSMGFDSVGKAFFMQKIIEVREEILVVLKNGFWSGLEERSLLDLVISCDRSFNNLPPELILEMTENSSRLFKRASKIGSVLVVLSLSMGYMDFNFLRDIYNIAFFLDNSLTKAGLSYSMLEALELERASTGKGMQYLKDNSNGSEEDILRTHAVHDYEILQDDIKSIFKNQNLLKIITKHHEKNNGQGLPKGLADNETSDLETLSSFVSHSIPFKDVEYSLNDGTSFLKEIFESNGNRDVRSIISYRIEKMITKVFCDIEDENSNYMELEGL